MWSWFHTIPFLIFSKRQDISLAFLAGKSWIRHCIFCIPSVLCVCVCVADLSGNPPPKGPKFSQFHAVFWKILPNCMLAPPPMGILVPPLVCVVHVSILATLQHRGFITSIYFLLLRTIHRIQYMIYNLLVILLSHAALCYSIDATN